MQTGTLKFFNFREGYGFIIDDNGGPDTFFHADDCHVMRSARLKGGERMQFNRYSSPTGWRARNVILADQPGYCPCCGRNG